MVSNTVLCLVFQNAGPSIPCGTFTSMMKKFAIIELNRVCLHVCKAFVFVAGSSQWSKWPIRNAVCLTVSRSQPEPPTVAFPKHPPFMICVWACRLVILFVLCITLCIWEFYFICVYLLMHGYCLLNMVGHFLCVPMRGFNQGVRDFKTFLCACTKKHLSAPHTRTTQWFMWNMKGM